MRQFDANPQDAGYGPDWYDSVAFCRWLSQPSGLSEWTHNWYEEYGVEALTDPHGAKEGSSRIFRGGSWEHDAAMSRAAARATGRLTDRASYVGFRLAFRLSEPTSEPESVKGVESTDGGPTRETTEQQR